MLFLDSLLLWISDSLLCMHSPTHPPQSTLSYSGHLPQKLKATPTPATGQMTSEEIYHLPWWWLVQVWAHEGYRGFQRETLTLLLGMIISTHGEWEWLATLSSISGWCKRNRMKKIERQYKPLDKINPEANSASGIPVTWPNEFLFGLHLLCLCFLLL